jgi:putative DNA primase/helicase
MSELGRRCERQWSSILTALGLLDRRALSGKDTACPHCGGKDRFRFGDKGRGLWYCHHEREGGDGIKLVMKLMGVDFRGAAKLIEGVIGASFSGSGDRHASPSGLSGPAPVRADDKPKDPLRAWHQALPDIRGTAADIYLQSRGLTLTEAEMASVRFHPALWHWPSESKWPAMIALVGPASGPAVTCHQTFLDIDGSAKAPVERPRLFPAGIAPTGGVWFGQVDPQSEFIVSEGIESTLSAMRLYGASAGCAALSEGGMRRLILPRAVRSMRIFADHDEPGQGVAAATEAARRWRAEGRKVAISMATEPGTDANDILMRRLKMAAAS